MNISLVAIAVAMALEERQEEYQAAQELEKWTKPKKEGFVKRLTGFVKSIIK